MYNPNTLITAKEEQYEIPPAPIFKEDPMDTVFRMFQENGTGDPIYVPVDQTSAVHRLEPEKPKLCPFRKRTWFYTNDNYKSVPEYANHIEEDFLPCVKSECMFYNAYAPGGPCCTK